MPFFPKCGYWSYRMKFLYPLVFVYLCCSTVAQATAPADAVARMQKLLPEAEVKPLDPREWTVERAMENPFVGMAEKSAAPRKITTASAFQFAGLVVVEDASNGRW